MGLQPTPGKVVYDNLMSVTDWGDANTILLGLVSVGQYDHYIKLIETDPSSI